MSLAACSLAALCLLAAAPLRAEGGETAEVRLKMPYRGQLVLQVPRAWKSLVRQPPTKRRPPTLIFTPETGASFKFLVTAVWPGPMEPPRTSDDDRVFVQRAAQRAQSRSFEEDLPILELKGRSGPGFYYSATDRAADPNGYQFVTEGVLQVNGMSVSFTILRNDRDDPVLTQALDAVKGAVRDTDK